MSAVMPPLPIDDAPPQPVRGPVPLLQRPEVQRVVYPALVAVVLLGLWQGLVVAFNVPHFLVPSPLKVAQVLVADAGLLFGALLNTLTITLLAFVCATIVGVLIAFAFVQSRLIETAFFPYAVLLQVTPIVAIAPLIIIWVKSPMASLVICATLVALFPIISNTTLGLRSVNPGLASYFKLNRATRLQMLLRLRIPSALPYFFGGLRISSGLALIGAVVAEFVAGTGGTGTGLAYQILQAGYQLNIPRMFAALVLITATGVGLFAAMAALSQWALGGWHESETRMNDLLLRGARAAITGLGGDAARLTKGTDIRVRGGVIAAIGSLAPEPGETVIDASGCVVYPGWVNTHHHLFQSLLKGVPAGINLPLVSWLAAVPVAYRRFFDREEALRIAARVGLVELALSGCSTVADHQYHYYPGMPFDASAVVFEEAERLGLRFVLCRGGQTVARAMTDAAAPPQVTPETLEAFMASVERDVQRFHDPGPMAMRRVASAITTPNWSCKPEHLKPLAQQARRLGIRLHSHLSETFDYVSWARELHRCTPMQFVAEHEWVGDDVWYAHMVHLSDEEIRFCARTGTGIAHCPQSNARLGSGIARVPELLAAGARVGLAVDGAASNEAADMLSEAHACWLVHRADPRAAPRIDPAREGGHAGAMTVDEVVRIGSAGGAQLLGLDGVGAIAVGQAADLAVYDLDQPRFFGLHDVAVGPVASGGRARLKALLVQGRVVVQDDQIPGLDLAALRRQAQALVDGMH